MRLITRDDIERWGKSYEAKGDFPILIAKLILASTPGSTRLRMPSGSSVFLSGWDGQVVCEKNTHFVREGVSFFELGTERNPAKKIKEDYQKRTNDPLGYEPSETILVLISPFTWNDKDVWVKEKNEENIWKEVIVYDANDLELWLTNCFVVSRWFLPKVGKSTSDGFLTADESWKEWSLAPAIELSPNIIVTGRDNECGELFKILNDNPSLIGIRASTRKEAVAFIIATGKLFNPVDSERFLSKTLVIENVNDYRAFARQNTNSLNLIANIGDATPLYPAVSNGHHVLVPLGAQDELNQKIIELPVLDRDGLKNILIDLGIEEDQAKRYVLESGRNITILKKFLGFPVLNIYQDQKKNAREIIPALLLGRWNEGFEGDIEILERLSGKKYSEYSTILNEWKNMDDSPLMQISNVWRLTSPLDLWTNLSKIITKDDLETLRACFKATFFNGNPDIESGEEVVLSSVFKRKKYSNFSREGLCQSLILVGLRGDALQMPYSQIWVDNIIHDLLVDASGELWISVNKELPLIAEASPKSFLRTVLNSLEKESPEIVEVFREDKGLFDSTYHYTGLLWALEGLAWFPEHLTRSTLILLKLDSIIPKLKWVNSPMNSLVEIFKPWHYQTLASVEDRMAILKQITSKEKESGWKLLIKLLPDSHNIAHSTHKTRWRLFDQNTNIDYTNKEAYDTHQFIIELLINLFDGDEIKFSELVEKVTFLPYQNDRQKVYSWAIEASANINQKEYKPWYTIRELLYRHRSYPDADWALLESELQQLEEVYKRLEPVDIVEKYKWLFDSFWPHFPEGVVRSDPGSRDYKKNNEPRRAVVEIWIKELGFEKTILLRNSVKDPKLFAEILAEISVDEEKIIAICECFKGNTEDILFGKAFIRHKSYKENFEWVQNLITRLKQKGFNNHSISSVLVSIHSNKEIYDFIETLDQELQDEYWTNVGANYGLASIDDAVYVINKLDKYKRYFTALEVVESVVNEIPTDLITSVLYKAVSEESSEPVDFNRLVLINIFETLYDKDDLDKSLMIKIEWLCISLFDRYSTLKPKYLEDELTSNPSFFIEVINWLYFPNDRERYYEEKAGVPEEKIEIIAKQSKILLDSWNSVPGMREDNSLDTGKLLSWISKARELAEESDRLEVTDMEIGTLLSKLPEDSDEIPSEEIFRVIEETNSEELNRSYSIGLSNKRGSTIRGPFDGGAIERGYAAFFKALAQKYAMKYPTVSEIFNDLEKEYLSHAKYEDDRAKLDGFEY